MLLISQGHQLWGAVIELNEHKIGSTSMGTFDLLNPNEQAPYITRNYIEANRRNKTCFKNVFVSSFVQVQSANHTYSLNLLDTTLV